MDVALKSIIEAIHASPFRASLIISGGASSAIGWLLSVPGSSSTITEISVPYSRRSMIQTLGKVPQGYCSMKTAEDLSLHAYHKAFSLSPPDTPVVGIGCTCTLASTSPKRGNHRCFVAARIQEKSFAYSLILKNGLRDRLEEDKITSSLVIQVLANVCEINSNLDIQLDKEFENLDQTVSTFSEQELIQQILDKKIDVFMLRGTTEFENGTLSSDAKYSSNEKRRVVLSGSFNPLHDGHLKLLSTAIKKVENGFPCFELSIFNADKPPLMKDEILKRLQQFKSRGLHFALTNAPLFVQKSKIFNDSTFVVGYDTAIRLIDPKYYGGKVEKMLEEMNEIRKNGCDFIVGGRTTPNGFRTMEDVSLPKDIQDMFLPISEQDFRLDISSTEIRKSLMDAQANKL